ncbi:hypothetical protein AAHA92_07086 [Salvia divinorum]|uniref:Myb/SANT-like domain-containing protein n=1 Tax=Salvia divinorum TaxID=28513 RepID=A0ABD1IBC6_SALDI
MASHTPPQSVFLYKCNWTAEIDEVMLCTILRMKKAANWEGTVIPPEFLREAITDIKAEVGIQFSWDDVYRSWLFFEHRYRAFTDLVVVYSVHWNANTNVVTTPESVWDGVLKENKLAAAYYYIVSPRSTNWLSSFVAMQSRSRKRMR